MAEKHDVEALLKKAQKPSEDAMRLHPFYKGKIAVTPKCRIRDFDDFAIWYTPGVAAPCRAIAQERERVYDYTSKWNTIAVVSDGTRVLGLGDIGPEAGLPALADDTSQPDLEPAPIGNLIRAGHYDVMDAPAGAELGRRSEGVEYVPGDTNLSIRSHVDPLSSDR